MYGVGRQAPADGPDDDAAEPGEEAVSMVRDRSVLAGDGF
jgi:hypothetical protein